MLTVLITTYNRAQTLSRTLSAFCRIQEPRGGWKLVIVDNGSTDATKEIIFSFMDRLPIAYFLELSRGKNTALNTGLASVEGDLVVLTDDDVLPRFDWLKEMRLAADSHASFSVFGGRVIPRWEIRPEEWILSWVKLGPVFTCTDPSWEEGPLPPEYVFGCNMAIRTRVFEAGYRFNPDIGPRGNSYAMGSETELTLRLAKAGINAWHCKQAVVEHIVPKLHMTRAWILSRALRFGRGQYRLRVQHESLSRKKNLGIPRYLIKEVVEQSLRVGYAKLRRDKAKLFEKRWIFNYLLGQMMEARLIYKELRSSSAVQGLSSRTERLANPMRND